VLRSHKRWNWRRRAIGLVLLGLCLVAFLSLVPLNAEKGTKGTGTVQPSGPQRYAGFSVFGPDWQMEREFAAEAERVAYLEEQGYLVAQHTSRLSGNLVRVPISMWSVLGQVATLDPDGATIPVYQLDDSAVGIALDKMRTALDASAVALNTEGGVAGNPLRWDGWDAFFLGIQRFNQEISTHPAQQLQPVFVNIFLTELPPALLIEAPVTVIDQVSRKALWESYRQLHIAFIRRLIQRYGRGYHTPRLRAHIPVAVAVEMVNEPDYNWLPDEAKIEKALDPTAYPCDKYITQLHLPQIPKHDLAAKGCVQRPFYYEEQDFGQPAPRTALRDFRWGRKFAEYVSTFADLHEHVSFAARDEIHRGGAQMTVVSSAVTHVNIDWFVHMFRANPNTFRYVDGIGIHPYHWPRHDIHDMHFVSSAPEKDWQLADPQEFARDYFKRFDFIRQLAALVAEPDQEKSYGLTGKSLWITEFGIPTKKLGKANAELPTNWKIFIYDRASAIPEGMPALIWEEKWEAFFRQVSPDFLFQNHVQTFLVYTLRESAQNETNDDNHSNFALYRPDWSCRLASDVLDKLRDFFRHYRNG
jgi:hypothetical protein